MFKTTPAVPNKNQSKSQPTRRSEKRRYHVLGICRDDTYRDPSTLTFAKLGLLAYRW